ncbi:hypothetical protein QC761_0044780 [Podospora bellae-mahoneyi]|uniref:Secreted protein n=1 Tax=Podospora bellae-mahoneyi TaxID=2093777 RepID=A0ABR0FT33_9PEZI|nr:hypothetical protein QC761_0044780 [Podospora bellae-mahoneyi]
MEPPQPPKPIRFPRSKRILLLAFAATAAFLPRPSSFGSGGGGGPTCGMNAVMIPTAIRLRESIKERAGGTRSIPRPPLYLARSTTKA